MLRFALAAALTAAALAQSPQLRPRVPTPVPAEVAPEDRGSVEGSVSDQATGAPIRKATLTLRRTQGGPNESAGTYMALTDAGGKFRLGEVDPGRYIASVEKTGYVGARYGARAFNAAGTTIVVEKKQRVKDIDFRLTPQSVILGRVVDEDGDPLQNVLVQAQRWSYLQGRKQLIPSFTASTNDLGEFRMFGVAPGKYLLLATVRGNMGWDESSHAKAEETYAPTFYPGSVSASGATVLDIAAGAQLSGQDIRLRRVTAVGVRGRLIAPAGVSPRNATIRIISSGDSMFTMNMRPTARPYNANGDFVISRVTPGSYTASAMLQDGKQMLFGSTNFEVGTSPVETLTVEVGAGFEIRGALKIAGSNPNLKPSEIRLQFVSKSNSMMFNPNPVGEVKEDGTFTFSRVARDRFNIVATAPTCYLKSATAGGVDVLDAGLDLSSGAPPADLTIVYSTDAGEIQGSVEPDKPGEAPIGTVVAVPAGERRKIDRYYSTAQLDQTGRFTLNRLAPGEYKIFAFDNVEYGAYLDADWLKPFESKGESVKIEEGARQAVSLKPIRTLTDR